MLHIRLSRSLLLTTLLALVAPAAAQAQGARSVEPRLEFSVGAGVVSGHSFGSVDANIRTNAQTLTNYRLFTATTALSATPAFDVRMTGRLTTRMAVEGQLLVGQSTLRTTIASDVESTTGATLSSASTDVVAGGGLRLQLNSPARARRLRTHATVGLGVTRSTFDGIQMDPRGTVYAGAGLRYGLGTAVQGVRRHGVRADVQVRRTQGSVVNDDGLTQVQATVAYYVGF